MNDDVRKLCLKDFFHRSNLASRPLPLGIESTIYSMSTPFIMFIECFHLIDHEDPENGIIMRMIDRAYHTAIGALTLAVFDQFREAEVLARTLYESSATCSYILDQKTSTRLVNYLRSYTNNERKQNKNWLKSIGSNTNPWSDDHRKKIADKDSALDKYDSYIDGYKQFKKIVGEESALPNLLKRVTEVSHEVHYRTVYSAMCSQTHHDAEDILNFQISLSAPGLDAYDKHLKETKCFGIYILLMGVLEFVNALIVVAKHFGLDTVLAEAIKSKKRLIDELEEVGPSIERHQIPEKWTQLTPTS